MQTFYLIKLSALIRIVSLSGLSYFVNFLTMHKYTKIKPYKYNYFQKIFTFFLLYVYFIDCQYFINVFLFLTYVFFCIFGFTFSIYKVLIFNDLTFLKMIPKNSQNILEK